MSDASGTELRNNSAHKWLVAPKDCYLSCVATKQEGTSSQPRMNSFYQLCIAGLAGRESGCRNILCLSLTLTWARASCEVIATFMPVKRGNLLIVSRQGLLRSRIFVMLFHSQCLSFVNMTLVNTHNLLIWTWPYLALSIAVPTPCEFKRKHSKAR